MSAISEDELLESLTWSDELSFTLDEFIHEYNLPQVVRVERGHDGGADSTTLGYGEVLTLHALRETPMLAAQDKQGEALAVRLDCPYKVHVLPQLADCKLDKCEVGDLPLIYPNVKFLQVIGAHYGTTDESESTNVGELMEIIGIEKRQRKVKVKNPETDEITILSSACSAEFRLLRDWRSYAVKDLRNHFSFPIRVRFLLGDDEAGERDESLGFLSKVSDLTVLKEFREVLVITTTPGSCADLKYCYEIPKDLGVKVVVTEDMLSGDRHYQEVVSSLDKGFDVSRFMNTQRSLEICKRRDVIKGHDYESQKELFLSAARQDKKATKEDDNAPVLPPRKAKITQTKSVPLPPPLSPPQVPKKSPTQRRARSIDECDVNSRPAVAPRPTGTNQSDAPPVTVRPQSFAGKLPHDDELGPMYTVSPVNISKSPVIRKKQHPVPLNTQAEKKAEGAKRQPDFQSVIIQLNSAIIKPPSSQQKVPFIVPRDSQPNAPDHPPNARDHQPNVSDQPPNETDHPPHDTDHPRNAPCHPPNDPDHQREHPEQSPLSRPPIPKKPASRLSKIPKGAQMVLPQLPARPPSIPKVPSDPDPELTPPPQGNETEVRENEAEISTKDDDEYEELEPIIKQEIVTQQPVDTTTPTPSDAGSHGDNPNNGYAMVVGGSVGTRCETEDPYAMVATIPEDLSHLSVKNVSELLRNLHMECYVDTFEEEMIDGNLLKSLDENALQSLNVSAFHTKKLMRFINGWRPKL